MKELYRNFLYIPKGGKVPEKVMLVRVGIAVAFILMCLVAMSVSAYAFFTSTVTSAPSIIRSAVYQLEVVSDGFEEQDGVYTLTNTATDAVKTFDFTIKPTVQSNATVGYAKIIIHDGENELKIFTAPIWTNENNEENGPVSRTFSIDVMPNSKTTMTVISQWGSCSSETVAEGGLLVDLTYVAPTTDEEEKEEPQEEPQNETPQEPAVTPDPETETEPEQTPSDETPTPPAEEPEITPNTPEPSTPPADTEEEPEDTSDAPAEDESTEGEQPTDPQPEADNGDGSQTEDTPTDPV